MSVSIGYTYSFNVVYEFVRTTPSWLQSCKKKGLCLFFHFFAHPVPVPKSQVPRPPPSRTPAAPLRSRDLYRTKNTVISARSSVTGPPRSSAPSPLHPHPAGCVVLCCTATSFSATVHRVRVQPVQSSQSIQSVRQSVSLAGGSRRSSFLLAVRGSKGPQPGMLVGASPATQGSGPKHLLSSPLAPGGQGSRPHLFGACDSMPFPSSPLLLVSACPFSTCPQPVLTSLSPSCKLLWSAALVLLGLLLSHQGLYADNLILLPRLIQLTLARAHTHTHTHIRT